MQVEFEIIGEIKTKMRPRASVFGGHAHIYTPKDTIYYENYVRQCYLSAIEQGINIITAKEKSFGDKPIKVSINAQFKAPKKYDKFGANVKFLACDKSKDLDNIAKIVCDSLNKIAYNDDKQICDLIVEKHWTNDTEKIIVRMTDVILTADTLTPILSLNEFKVKYKPQRKAKNNDK